MNVVEVRGLVRRFGGRTALDGLDMTVPRGRITGFLGPNGAGKTTTLRVLLGLVRADAGQVVVFGDDVRRSRRHLERTGALVEGPAFHPWLSGRDNLRVQSRLMGLPDAEVARVLELTRLGDQAGDRVGGWSLGQRQRLALAVALLGRPELLLLDEPQNGLDPDGMSQLRHVLRQVVADGGTVLLSSHALDEVDRLADRLVVLRQGRAVYEGDLAPLRAEAWLVVEAEDPADLPALAGLVGEARRDGDCLLVRRGDAAEINRAAHEAGITLVRLEVRRPSLEDLFLRLQQGDGVGPCGG